MLKKLKHLLLELLFNPTSSAIIAGSLDLSIISQHNSNTVKPEETKSPRPLDGIAKSPLDKSSKYFLSWLASVSV